jgi:hypothetical protein
LDVAVNTSAVSNAGVCERYRRCRKIFSPGGSKICENSIEGEAGGTREWLGEFSYVPTCETDLEYLGRMLSRDSQEEDTIKCETQHIM